MRGQERQKEREREGERERESRRGVNGPLAGTGERCCLRSATRQREREMESVADVGIGEVRLEPVTYASKGFRCSSLYSSKHTKPVTSAVVVAMAGMILPAICRDLCKSASGILTWSARHSPSFPYLSDKPKVGVGEGGVVVTERGRFYCLVLFCLCLALPCLVLCLALSCCVLSWSFLGLSCLALSCCVLSWLSLVVLVVSCLVLSCLVTTTSTMSRSKGREDGSVGVDVYIYIYTYIYVYTYRYL
jgi:hypothetical protein